MLYSSAAANLEQLPAPAAKLCFHAEAAEVAINTAMLCVSMTTSTAIFPNYTEKSNNAPFFFLFFYIDAIY